MGNGLWCYHLDSVAGAGLDGTVLDDSPGIAVISYRSSGGGPTIRLDTELEGFSYSREKKASRSEMM